ncbi:MAG: tetratricopeptide repeat protein [Planctomycetes bacterium]|nr:tetratricopeptide repeat protein [Planctomycetota bacterium]
MTRSPGSVLVALALAVALVGCHRGSTKEEQIRKAQKLYEEAVDLHEKGRTAAQVDRVALEDNKHFDQARERFREAIKANPDHTRLRFDFARVLYAEGNVYRDGHSVAFENQEFCLGEGKAEEAERWRKEGERIRDLAQERYREAIPHFRTVVEQPFRDPAWEAESLYALGWIYLSLEDYQRAYDYMKQVRASSVLRLGPDDQRKLDEAMRLIEDELVRQRLASQGSGERQP